MIKTLSIFPKQCALNSTPVMQAIVSSASRCGIEIKENSFDSDAAVIWSVLWKGRMRSNQQVYQHYRGRSLPVIVIDVGSLHRGLTWKIGINNINRRGEFGNHQNLDHDRPAKFGIVLEPGQSGNKILIAGQHNQSLQVQSLSCQEDWISGMIKDLKQHTDREIVIRDHPRSRLDRAKIPAGVTWQLPTKINDTYDDFDFDMKDVHAVINFSSSPGIQAAIAGVRPIVSCDSLAYPVGIDICDIDQPYCHDRQQWAVELAHTEYLISEIEQGVWINRLRDFL